MGSERNGEKKEFNFSKVLGAERYGNKKTRNKKDLIFSKVAGSRLYSDKEKICTQMSLVSFSKVAGSRRYGYTKSFQRARF